MKRILLIDDNKTLINIYKTILDEAGFETLTATSGEAALEALDSDQPVDLVLLDWLMPGGGGASALSLIQDQFPHLADHTPIVGFSSLQHRPDDVPESLTAFEQKPADISGFLGLVDRYIPTSL